MSHFDPTDPAAEIKYLKALEKGKGWPQEYPDSAKVKKGKDWPAAVDAGKKKTPRHVARTWGAVELQSRPLAQEGIPPAIVARALLLLASAIAAALLID